MGDGLQQKRNEVRPARHRIEPAVDPDRATPRVTAILGLQRAAGNRAVAQLLAQVAKPARGTIQRLRTADQWVTDTTTYSGLMKKKDKRSEGLKRIDARLLEYEAALERGDLDAAMAALNEVGDLVGKWRLAAEPKLRGTFSPEERAAAEAHGAKKVKNWQEVAALKQEVEAEIKTLQKRLYDRDAAREEAKAETRAQERIDPLIPKSLKKTAGVSAKALELFRIFMEQFRGTAVYTTSSLKGVSIWDESGTTACATNCYGLVELLRRGGLEADVVELTQRYFVTHPLGQSFIDPSAPGNVSFPGKTLEATRRYFFTQHWIVAVKSGPFLDPTSGIVTDAAGTDVVDPAYKGFAMTTGDYENGEYKIAVVGKDDRGGSRYAMSPLKGA